MMIKLFVTIPAIFIICFCVTGFTSDQDEILIDEFGRTAGTIEVNRYFKPSLVQDIDILVNPYAVRDQADEILSYFEKHATTDNIAAKPGILSRLGVTLLDVESTLDFIKQALDEDISNGRRLRIRNPEFLEKHFRMIRWYPFNGKKSRDKIRITKYAIFTIKGQGTKSPVFKYALYSLPHDELNLSPEEIKKTGKKLSRFKYTKQQAISGVYDNGGATPLVWLTRKGLEEALLEGSICVAFPDGTKKYYNVNRNNGISWDPEIKNQWHQKRYWYFKEVKQPRGYGMSIDSQISIFPYAAIAGDVYNLGLGKLIGMSYKTAGDDRKKMRIGVLADTGGAFTPNLHQLDFYAGIFIDRKDYENKIKTLPKYAEVYLMVLKRDIQ